MLVLQIPLLVDAVVVPLYWSDPKARGSHCDITIRSVFLHTGFLDYDILH